MPIRQHANGDLKGQASEYHHIHEHGGLGYAQSDLDRKDDTQRIEGTDHQTSDASADHANLGPVSYTHLTLPTSDLV